jgi:hypothetical protein
MGLSILELVQNRFPFPGELPPVDLIMHISASEVGLLFRTHEGGMMTMMSCCSRHDWRTNPTSTCLGATP